jgi:tetratricopeptide (TPR) repeat protein
MAKKRKRKNGIADAAPAAAAPVTTTGAPAAPPTQSLRTSPPALRIVEPIVETLPALEPIVEIRGPVAVPDPPAKSIAPQPPPFERAMAEYGQGRMLEALALFDAAVVADPTNHRARSFWGMLLVLERGQQKRGLEEAEEAAAKAPDDVDVWLNLARIFVKLEQKGRAIDVLRAGMQHHAGHDAVATMLQSLGVRRTPPIKSLPRSHPLNKWVGIALYRWLKIGRT